MAGPSQLAWVTGAAGFIGAAAVRRFRDAGWRTIAFDRRAFDVDATPADHFLTTEIDRDVLARAGRIGGAPDAVFHSAGTGTVGRAEADPAAARADTVATTQTLIAWLAANAPKARLIVPSSAAVYGNAGHGPLREDFPVNPISLYGRLKAEVEQVCADATAAHGLSTAIIRFFSVYGRGLRKQLPWDVAQKLLSAARPVTLFGTGDETRDFLAVEDAAGLIFHLAVAPRPNHVVVNGGTGTATTVRAFATGLAAALGVSSEFAYSGEVRAGDPTHYKADIIRAREIGFVPKITLAQGLARYAAWIKSESEKPD